MGPEHNPLRPPRPKGHQPELLQPPTKAEMLVQFKRLQEASDERHNGLLDCFTMLSSRVAELKHQLASLKEERANEPKLFYSVREFCQVTGLKYQTVLNYCKQGKLKATQMSDDGRHCWLISREEVEKIIRRANENVV